MGNEGKINNSSTAGVLRHHKRRSPGNSDNGNLGEFKSLLKEKIIEARDGHGINLSNHAAKRIESRQLEVDSNEFIKLRGAIDKLKDKGGQESLVITDKAAYIVDVNNNKIVTAIDKGSIDDSVFTKIDSTLVVN